jgi:hypothetical protein
MNAFALDLYRQLVNDKDKAGRNLWFSPYSITSAGHDRRRCARQPVRDQSLRAGCGTDRAVEPDV